MTGSGEMRIKIVYQEPTQAKDALGQPIKTWVDVFEGFGALRPLTAREINLAGQTTAEATHRLAIRWRPGVKPTGRFLVAGTDRVLNISGALNVNERNAEIVLTCVEAIPGS